MEKFQVNCKMPSLRFHYAVHPEDDLRVFCVEIPNYDAGKISVIRDYTFSCRDKAVHAFNVRHLSNDIMVYIKIFFASYCLMVSLHREIERQIELEYIILISATLISFTFINCWYEICRIVEPSRNCDLNLLEK